VPGDTAPQEDSDQTTPPGTVEGEAKREESPQPEPEESATPPASKTPQSPTPQATPPQPAKPPQTTTESPGASPKASSAQALFKEASPAVVRIVVRDEDFKQIGLGSGFLVTRDGWVVTNHHVVAKARFATVVLPSQATLFVEGVLALNEEADLAVLKVNGRDLPYLKLSPKGKTFAVGTQVYAIGNPQGLSNTLSEGLISGVRPLPHGLTLLQTTAAISPGSSGGPLLDAGGDVVGVTSASLAGPDVQNLNFAVPADKVRQVLVKAGEGKPQPLASAGGRPLDRQASKDLQDVWTAMGDERWRDAVSIIQRLREKAPSNPLVWFMLGWLHLRLGNHDLALEAFREEVRLAPEEALGHFGLGMAYHDLKRYAESVAALQASVRMSPNFFPTRVYLGMALYSTGRFAESVAACKAAIRLRPDEALAYYYLGLDYVAMRDRTRAFQAYQTLSKLAPDLAADLRSSIDGR